MRLAVLLIAAACSLVEAPLAQAQTSFFLRVQRDNNIVSVANGATLPFTASAIGKTVTLKLTVTYQGLTSATFDSPAVVSGSTNFSLSQPTFPVTVTPGQTVTLDITYTAKSGTPDTAILDLPFVETAATTGGADRTGLISFVLSGTSPELTVSYELENDVNVIALPSGGTLSFSSTVVNGTATAQVIITNRGSGSGEVSSIAVSGSAFQPIGLPLTPATVASGTDLRFNIRYRPRQIGSDTGTMTIGIGDTLFTFNLVGSSTNSLFSYELVQDGNTTEFVPNQTLSLPDAKVGEISSVTILVHNVGTDDAVISNIASNSSNVFLLSNLPFLPLTLAPGASTSFTLNFVPTIAGQSTARLRIGPDSFDLTAKAIGPQLQYSYTNSASTVTVQAGGAVLFSPLQVGLSSSVTFTFRNAGTADATVSSISITDTKSAFAISGLPALPLSLAPDASASFTVKFTPATTGAIQVNLVVEATAFALVGFGTAPPPLPSFSFQGATSPQDPLQQPAVGLALAEPYSIAVNGTLNLTFDSDAFVSDPAVQFASGGQTASFTIPAGATQAVFPNGSTSLRFQTGSVAGTLNIRPAFATTGGFDLTPSDVSPLRIVVSAAAPHLISTQVVSKTATSFVVEATGYASTRTLSKMDFQFTAAGSDVNLSGTAFGISISGAADTWFRSSTSQTSFGGQFTISVPFTLSTSGGTVASPVDAIQSVAVTVTNDKGTSNSMTAAVR
jgi:HYDIN/CFA65/VesB-like, Ig-like domain